MNTAPSLGRIQTTLQRCQTFTLNGADGTSTNFAVSPLPMPSYGDRSLAIRMVGLTGGIPVVLDIVLVADGRTGISVMAGGVSPVSSQELRMFVTKPLAKLHRLTATYALRSHCQATREAA